MDYDQALALLQLSPDFDERKLRRAYRRLASEWHPDRNQGDPLAHERFLSLREAYEVLREAISLPAPAILKPFLVPCVTMGRHLVASIAISTRELRRLGVRRGAWVPLQLWATRPCAECGGNGEVVVGQSFFRRPVHAPCPVCDGVGLEGISRAVRMRMPAIRRGTTLRLRGLGLFNDAGRGDVVLQLQ